MGKSLSTSVKTNRKPDESRQVRTKAWVLLYYSTSRNA